MVPCGKPACFFLPMRLWTYRKVLVAARLTTIRRHMQQTPHERQCGADVFGGDPFYLCIAANRTMCVKRFTKWHEPCVKPRPAVPAPPRVDANTTQNVVRCGMAARTPGILTLADWAYHCGSLGPPQARQNRIKRQGAQETCVLNRKYNSSGPTSFCPKGASCQRTPNNTPRPASTQNCRD